MAVGELRFGINQQIAGGDDPFARLQTVEHLPEFIARPPEFHGPRFVMAAGVHIDNRPVARPEHGAARHGQNLRRVGEHEAFVRKTVGIEAQLKKIVNGIDGIKKALIYGSYAKDNMRQDSDVDLMVVVNDLKVEDKLVDELSYVEKVLGREVNYKFYDERDFKQRLKKKDPFLTEVLSNKYVVLKGDL